MKHLTKFMSIALVLIPALTFSQLSWAKQQIDSTLSSDNLTSVTNVTIEIRMGEVTIVGWDKNEVHVEGELDNNVDEFIFKEENGQIIIKTKYENSRHSGHSDTDLTIKIPKNLRASFDGVSGDVVVKNLRNNARINTVSGDIKASDLNGNIELSSVSGRIKSNNLDGKISLSGVSGDIDDSASQGRLELRAVSGEISSKSSASQVFVESVSGDVTLALGQIEEIRVATVSGEVNIALTLNKNGVLKVNTVSGDTAVDLQKDIEADFRLNASAGGRLINKLTNDKAKRTKYGPNSTLIFQPGDANASISMNTVSGELVVK
jgi:DUF4097 and DUF4098 domain-containing protein YvlB